MFRSFQNIIYTDSQGESQHLSLPLRPNAATENQAVNAAPWFTIGSASPFVPAV
jgi:hypothetical protein